MARRRRTSPAEDLLDLVALLPWIALYFFLHHVASQPVPTAAQPGQLGAMVAKTLWRTLASYGQYLLPLICLAGAAVSAWRRKERRQVTDVAQSRAADALDGMSWQQFEKLVGEGFRLQGYRVAETGGGGADGGIDLVLSKGGEKFLVQCKQWRAQKVGVDVVGELYGVMAARGATGGFVVTAGRFTAEAAAFANGRNVSLTDGPELLSLLRRRVKRPRRKRRLERLGRGRDSLRPRLRPLPCKKFHRARFARSRWFGASPSAAPMPVAGFGAARRTRRGAGPGR